MHTKTEHERNAYCRSKWLAIQNDHEVRCLELNISEMCNYRCPYCIFHRFNGTNKLMVPELAKEITEKFLRYLNQRKGIIYLGSGEPLLNWEQSSL